MAYNDTTTASFNSENLIAAQVLFDHKKCSLQPDRFIEKYCQLKRNGGGDISTIIYPWEENRDKALVIFDAEYSDKGVVGRLAELKKPPIQEILEFSDSQCFGLAETSIAQPLLTRLQKKFTIDKLKSRIELETGIQAVVEESSSRLLIKGFFFQIKLAEAALKRLSDEIADQILPSQKALDQPAFELDDPSVHGRSAAEVHQSPINSNKKDPLLPEESEKLAEKVSTDSIPTTAALNTYLESTLPNAVRTRKTPPNSLSNSSPNSLPNSPPNSPRNPLSSNDLSRPSTISRNNSKNPDASAIADLSESDDERRNASKTDSTHNHTLSGGEPLAGDKLFENEKPPSHVEVSPTPPSASPAKLSSGDPQSETFGETSGDPPSETSGDPPSETSGDPPSETSGDPPSETSGDPPSETSGEPPSETSVRRTDSRPAADLASVDQNHKAGKDTEDVSAGKVFDVNYSFTMENRRIYPSLPDTFVNPSNGEESLNCSPPTSAPKVHAEPRRNDASSDIPRLEEIPSVSNSSMLLPKSPPHPTSTGSTHLPADDLVTTATADAGKTTSVTDAQAAPSPVSSLTEPGVRITPEESAGLAQSTNSSLDDKSKPGVSNPITEIVTHVTDASPAAGQAPKSEVLEKEGEFTLVTQQMDNLKPEEEEEETVVKGFNRSRRQTEVKDEFDKFHYEFLKIIHAKDLTSKILEKFKGKLTESEHPDNDQLIIVRVKSYTHGEAERMMDALIELFNDVTKSVYSHSIKFNYDGDKQELAKALIEHLRGPEYGFIARLVANDGIRIIGSLANKDKDVRLLERYISHYKKKRPAHHVMQKKQFDITLPNGTVVSVMQGDLTKMKTDAVVSSSGADLAHQRGVSKAIAIACGQRFQIKGKEFLRTGGFLKEGDTFVQPADGELAKLGVRCVIHAIAPLPKKGADVQPLLVKTIREALKEAENLKFKTIAFPAICAGVMGVPIAICGLCYWVALAMFSSKHPVSHLKQICFVVDDSRFMQELYRVMADMSAKGKDGYSDFHLLWEQTENLYAADQTAVAARGRPADNKNPQSATGMQISHETAFTGAAYNYANNAVANLILGMPAAIDLSPEHADVWPKLKLSSPYYPADTQDRAAAGAATGYSAAAATDSRTATGVKCAYGGAAYKDKSVWAGVHKDPQFKPTAGTNPAAAAAGTSKPNERECPICLDELRDVEALPCSHKFCKNCISLLVITTKSNQCPTCRYPLRNGEGKQPKGGRMTRYTTSTCLPEYEHF
ncbi:uncharacterized protein [Watersipora subatra]|uniref:uncharacterized protein isoform X2 n=1 Tax=Watersipora subatra TaxID=2589382 RepID=UPI00355C326C